jgi:hypothetical protein
MRCEDRIDGIGGCNAPTYLINNRCFYCGIVYCAFSEEEIDTGIMFVGWVHGSLEDKKRLKSLGVRGSMYFSEKDTAYGTGVIEHCSASPEVFWKLVHIYKISNPGSFTVVDRHDRQLSWEKNHPRGQRYWHNLVENSSLSELRQQLKNMVDKPKPIPFITIRK